MTAGIFEASGNYVIIMDGDLQNPPSEIPRLYSKIKEGFDIVYTTSPVRNGFFDEMTSSLFWYFISNFLAIKVVQNQLMLKIMTKDFVRSFKSYGETIRVIGLITSDMGFKSTILEVKNQHRPEGRSHYTIRKRFNLALDLFLGLSNRPLDFLIFVGFFGILASLALSGYHFYKFLVEDVTPGFTSIIISILFIGSMNLGMLGILGRFLSMIYVEVRQRPLYFIQERFNL